MFRLCTKRKFTFPIIAESISPDVFEGRTSREIELLSVWEGNKQKTLGELFRIEDDKTESLSITISGDVSKIRRIGVSMTKGSILINGNAGMHLGEEMKGGKVVVYGNVASWAGSMMKGGEIEVFGSAGDYLGGPYRGCGQGMVKGRIIVHGNAGTEIGAYMKDGIVKVYGNADQFAGFHMNNGTVYIQGSSQGRAGASMLGGRIVVGGFLESVLPTFTVHSVKAMAKIEKDETVQGPFIVFLGDLAENGRGKLYVSRVRNSHLTYAERFL